MTGSGSTRSSGRPLRTRSTSRATSSSRRALHLLVVTDGVRGADGEPLDGTRFRHELNFGQTNDLVAKAYRKSLLDALELARAAGVKSSEIATASLFTTQTITAISNKIRAQIQAAAPPVANFVLGTNGERTVFPLTSITAVQWNRQLGTASFGNTLLPVPALSAFGATVGTVAFGSFASRDYETADKVIPAVGTATGIPVVQSTNTLGFTLFVPSGSGAGGRLAGRDVRARLHRQPRRRAVGGCVVAREPRPRVDRDQRGGTRRRAARPLHGAPNGGAPSVVLSDGGRSIDQNGNGVYDLDGGRERGGANALIGNRDGLRQTVVDLMQLVRMLQGGVDVDADGSADLSSSRIYYAGQSFGGIYGVALESSRRCVRASRTSRAGRSSRSPGSRLVFSRSSAFRSRRGCRRSTTRSPTPRSRTSTRTSRSGTSRF